MDCLIHTQDSPPATIAVHAEANRTGPPEVLQQLRDPETAGAVDARRYRFRLNIKMETSDERYAEKLNFGMWVGSGLKNDLDVVFE